MKPNAKPNPRSARTRLEQKLEATESHGQAQAQLERNQEIVRERDDAVEFAWRIDVFREPGRTAGPRREGRGDQTMTCRTNERIEQGELASARKDERIAQLEEKQTETAAHIAKAWPTRPKSKWLRSGSGEKLKPSTSAPPSKWAGLCEDFKALLEAAKMACENAMPRARTRPRRGTRDEGAGRA